MDESTFVGFHRVKYAGVKVFGKGVISALVSKAFQLIPRTI